MFEKIPKRQVVKLGDVFMVPLRSGKFMYGRKINQGCDFYAFITDSPTKSMDELKERKVLFNVGIFRDVLGSGVWPKIGKLSFSNEEETWGSIKCIVRSGGKSAYYHKGAEFGHPTVEECYDKEHVIVYDRYDLEMRLLHYCETGADHPRMWDSYTADGNKPWEKIRKHELIDILSLNEKYSALGWIPSMRKTKA